ncbi:Maf family nucleotide pyrophosphatase [Roseimarinus sediminis]|uniref:Maf family nucleotide pyrophosphatase n=1 Tax=Roseimarinus sediminis TaxID=1610899 RepID=UPI003D261950
MLNKRLEKYRIILASNSPRRKQLLSELGLHFEVITGDVDEVFPDSMPVSEVAEYLARIKAEPFQHSLDKNMLVITADTIVSVDDQVLGKPANHAEATAMLSLLSGRAHLVSTGVHLLSQHRTAAFTSTTTVWFKTLEKEEIEYYVSNFQPFDKAGAYGIQEWIGHIGVQRIEGSYFNVMGLPVQQLYEALMKF